ncbi:Stk1 family PASTA domain-containing Ser/Thr kinase [Citricoccus sp. GCM10030269]|uniref:Stk1 family PASTA domain-containing Ser/Thr kinase n=1 Tax=Citricoccus sp. GCM10030269 TaxID=3273388 RepID=UPI00361534B8
MVKEHGADPMNGTMIEGRYEIRARLARGGMSTVYLAVDQRLDREVALKVLYPHLAENPHLVERFEQEAKTAAQLSHPHVVNVLDQGVDDHPDGKLAYLVMEYVPGYTLRTVLQRRRVMTPRVALAYLEAIVDGLAAAHRAGLVHRDMKPENVLVSRDGRIKVADFGLARATTNFTGTGASLVGTVAYVSPELVTGSPADERSDVYAVGIMVYEMLAGHQPFTGSSPIQVAYQHINQQVPPPSTAVPGLAAELDELVLWCTAPAVEDRPDDAGVLLQEIRRLRSALDEQDLDFQAPWTADSVESATAHLAGTAPDEDLEYSASASDVDATDVIQQADATDVLDGGATTVLSAPGYQSTSVLPTMTPDAAPTPLAAPPPPASASGQPASSRPLSKRRERRRQARQARTPTEDLGSGSRKRMWVWAAVVLILTAVLLLAGWFFGAGPGGVVTVPDVEGQSRAAAVHALQQTGVGFALARVHHDMVAENSVISTDPPAGSEVRRFNTVQVTVSLGPEMFEVPDVTGLEEDAAERELRRTELTLGTTEHQYSDAVAEGRVISQEPSSGTRLRRDRPVSVVVSEGPQPVAVPDIRGQTAQEAAATLESAGLQLELSGSDHSTSVQAGRIVSQKPADGEVAPGTVITAVQSLGPRMVEVPDVTGQTPDEAQKQLDEAGFEVEQTDILGDFFGTREGRVRNQTPDAGTRAAEGSTVRILVL